MSVSTLIDGTPGVSISSVSPKRQSTSASTRLPQPGQEISARTVLSVPKVTDWEDHAYEDGDVIPLS